MEVLVDFQRDWRAIATGSLINQGFIVDPNDDIRKLTYKVFNLDKRRVNAAPRQVFEASTFTCPAAHQNGYDALKAKLVAGSDVGPHLSKSLLKDGYEDDLLNDWGIHHFHLGQNPTASGFVERTGPLLFAYVQPNAFYCIGIYPHGSWAEQDLIRSIHDNWPQLIAGRQIKGVLAMSHVPTNDDIKAFRKVGIQTMVQVAPGVIYAPLGGGYTTAGTSIQSQMRANQHLRLLRALEDHVRSNADGMATTIRGHGHQPGDPMSMVLHIDQIGMYAVEPNSGVAFTLHKY